jgi:hypothetical protein
VRALYKRLWPSFFLFFSFSFFFLICGWGLFVYNDGLVHVKKAINNEMHNSWWKRCFLAEKKCEEQEPYKKVKPDAKMKSATFKTLEARGFIRHFNTASNYTTKNSAMSLHEIEPPSQTSTLWSWFMTTWPWWSYSWAVTTNAHGHLWSMGMACIVCINDLL